jgi:hypothetical protein
VECRLQLTATVHGLNDDPRDMAVAVLAVLLPMKSPHQWTSVLATRFVYTYRKSDISNASELNLLPE